MKNSELLNGYWGFSMSSMVPSRDNIISLKSVLIVMVFLWVTTLPVEAAQVILNSPVVISEADATYDGQDVVIDHTTVTINSAHSFNSVFLTNGAVLTHSASTTTNTHNLELEVAGAVVVSADSRIDVSGKGYVAGRTSGNTTVGASTGASGGSYGGLGGNYDDGVANGVYGDYTDPDDWGSGGMGNAGGGLVRLVGGSLVLDGQLLSDGSSGVFGVGSGGGIYVRVGTLSGVGNVRAAGGSEFGGRGGGGGGRIAIYASDWSGFTLANITAAGGTGGVAGGAGTVYLPDTDEPKGRLLVDGVGSGTGGWTPLGLPGMNLFTVPGEVVIRGSNTRVRPEHPGMALNFGGTLRIEASARMEAEAPLSMAGGLILDNATLVATNVQGTSLLLTNAALLTTFGASTSAVHKLDLSFSQAVNVSADSTIDVSGKGYVAGRTSGNTTVGASTGVSGGSYGGLGGNYDDGVANGVYGDYTDPDDWGSGGMGNAGGGLVRLVGGSLVLDGQLLSDGSSGVFGVGSGGGIYVRVGTLSGVGNVRAAGGSEFGGRGGGGGGRIAIYASDWSGFTLANITAAGGTGGVAGGAGTVYLWQGQPTTHARFTVPGVLRLFPTNNYVLPIPTLSSGLPIHFNRPIDTSSFSPDKLTIQGPLGSILPTGASEVGDRLYRFEFPPQTENGSYAFTLSQTLIDAEGFELDQNANGVPGEAEDAFRFTLVLDTVAPRIVQHAPAGDIAGTVTNVDLWFSEKIDRTTFTTADVSILDPAGATVTVSTVTEVGFNRYRVAFPAQTATGLYHVLLNTNITDLAGNTLPEGDPEPAIGYDASFNLVPVDLELSNVDPSTTELWAGDAMTISWQGRNVTGAPLLGSWIDSVYLSPDPFWNITDTLLGTVQHTGGLTAEEVYSSTLSFSVPGVLPGNYYFLVRADVGNQTRETAEGNNLVSFGPVAVAVRPLAIGGSLSGTITGASRFHYFAIQVPAGESLRLTLDGQSGVNHLFVNNASIPTRLNAEGSGTAASPDQAVSLTGVPGGGTYYLLVSGEQVGSNGNYTLTVDSASFFITDFTPNQLVGGVSPRFWVSILQSSLPTATLTGVGFDETMQVELVGSKGSVFQPSRKELVSSSVLRMVFPVEAWPEDVFDVRVTKGSLTRVLPGALNVSGSGEAKFEARIVGTALSPGGGQTIYVEYANTGTRPMPVPLLKVTAYTNAVIVSYKLNFRPQDRFSQKSGSGGGGGGRVWHGGYRFRVAVPLHTAQVMAIGSGKTPGVLNAGERGVVPVYFQGLLSDRGESSIQFSVGSLTADDTLICDCGSYAQGLPNEYQFPRTGVKALAPQIYATNLCPQSLFAPEWSLLEETSKPETVDGGAWHATWLNVMANAGPLWVDYLLMLGDNMNHLAKVNQLTNDPGQLFNFEVLQASAALNPVRTLAGAVDASAPAPGFPLVFRRMFAQPISSRYRSGPLGRGWSHNWNVSIQHLTQFQGVLIRGPSGADRLFGRFNDGVYTATDGDNAALIVSNGTFRLIEADKTTWVFLTNAPIGLLQHVEDPNGNRITCGYTSSRLTSLQHNGGKQFTLEYDGNGRLWRLTDPVGPGTDDDRITTYEYDASGEHLIRVTAPGSRVTTYAYDSTGTPQRMHALSSVTYPDLTQESFAYDAQGRLIQTAQTCCGGAQQQLTYTYDSSGTVTVTDATGRTTQLLYGLGGQLAQVRDGEGRVVNSSYDEVSRMTQLVGPGGERYRYSYDNLGNLTDIEDPLRYVNNFAYESSFNRLGQVRDARGNGLQYTYDTRGNLTAITYADGSRELFDYDARGNVSVSTNRRGGVITYAYNTAGQLTTKDYTSTPGITDFTYTYDSAGNLRQATYWNPESATDESLNLSYDPVTDRLTRIEYPGGKWFAFEYDAVGRRTRRADQDGNITGYAYDELGRLERMTNALGQLIVDYDFDPAGRLSRKTLGNGVYTTYDYNASGQVLQLVNRKPDNSVLSSFAYTYDASGRRDSMTTLAGSETYGYDPLGQLTSVTYPNGRVVTYAYDAAGNRTQVTDNGVPTVYAANTLNQYTSAGAATFDYDDDGNLTEKVEGLVTTTYVYDPENRLIQVATPSDTWTYSYDAFGNRIVSAHNSQTTRYVIDPTGLGNVAAEYDGSGGLIARYEHGIGLLARSDAAGDPAYYTFSAIGHTSELTGPSGAVANAYSYDPWGISLAKSETIPNPFEFVGEFGVMNDGNELEFMRARLYSSRRGVFIQSDPIGIVGGLNLQAYVRNQPTELIDPSGTLIYPQVLEPHFELPEDYLPGETWEEYSLRKDLEEHGDESKLIPNPYPNWDPSHPNDPMPNLPPNEFDAAERWPTPHTPPYIPPYIPPPGPDPVNNEDTENSGVFRSQDPNDKLGPSGYGTMGYFASGDVMPYQIRFENQPGATAPAQRVTVTDTLDSNFDLSSFELTEITFANQTISIPPGLNHYETQLGFTITDQTLVPVSDLVSVNGGVVVDVQAALDVPTRTFTLVLTTLDPATGWYPEDPLTGLLYPNDETGRGDGSVSFIVRPRSDVTTGSRIENRASIVFDYNDPIETPIVFNTLDTGTPNSQVQPLPSQSASPLTVYWSGADEMNGSGLAGYDIFVSIDGGPFLVWLSNTQSTSAPFFGVKGHTYAFYSVARDNVGHIEATPSGAQAQTTIANTAPTAVDDILWRPAKGELKIPASTLLANDTDVDGDSLVVSAVSPMSSRGASVTLKRNWIYYLPPEGLTEPDSFTYTMSDGAGALASATVSLTVMSDEKTPTLNLTLIEPAATGMKIHFSGIPGVSYLIQVSSDLKTWDTLGTQTANALGAYQIADPGADGASARFYRAVVP